MTTIRTAFKTELVKVYRSKVLLSILTVFIIVPAMMSFLFYVAGNPDLANKMGLIGTKAEMFGHGDWKAFLELINQIMAVLGLIGFGFATSWVFGREYAEHTLNDLLSLPIPRYAIVIAKLLVLAIIAFILSGALFITACLMASLTHIAGFSWKWIAGYGGTFALISFLTFFLNLPVAFFSSYGRGIMLPMGFVLITLIMAQMAAVIGLGAYFPWAVPGLLSIAEPEEGFRVNLISYIILFSVSAAGLIGTLAWWRYADQK
jgi:ABC-2 type transport system permease protein